MSATVEVLGYDVGMYVDSGGPDLILGSNSHKLIDQAGAVHARGEGLERSKTFLGLTLETPRDVLLLLVEEHLSRHILEEIGRVGKFDEKPGTGIAFQIDVEDAVGVSHQIRDLSTKVEEKL